MESARFQASDLRINVARLRLDGSNVYSNSELDDFISLINQDRIRRFLPPVDSNTLGRVQKISFLGTYLNIPPNPEPILRPEDIGLDIDKLYASRRPKNQLNYLNYELGSFLLEVNKFRKRNRLTPLVVPDSTSQDGERQTIVNLLINYFGLPLEPVGTANSRRLSLEEFSIELDRVRLTGPRAYTDAALRDIIDRINHHERQRPDGQVLEPSSRHSMIILILGYFGLPRSEIAQRANNYQPPVVILDTDETIANQFEVRAGEMERDAFIADGASTLLREEFVRTNTNLVGPRGVAGPIGRDAAGRPIYAQTEARVQRATQEDSDNHIQQILKESANLPAFGQAKVKTFDLESTSLPYQTLRLLLSITGFNLATFLERSKNSSTEIFEQGLKEYLQIPLSKGKQMVEVVASYLDLTFLILFSANEIETRTYDRKKDQILKALANLKLDQLEEFWRSYCQQYLEIETTKAARLIKTLDRFWSNNVYFSLDAILILAEHNIDLDVPIIAKMRTICYILLEAKPEIFEYFSKVYPRWQPPPLEKIGTSTSILRKNISLALGSCFVETYYPTPEGLVAIPYNIDLAQLNLEAIKQLAAKDRTNYESLRIRCEQEFTRTSVTLSNYLYLLL